MLHIIFFSIFVLLSYCPGGKNEKKVDEFRLYNKAGVACTPTNINEGWFRTLENGSGVGIGRTYLLEKVQTFFRDQNRLP